MLLLQQLLHILQCSHKLRLEGSSGCAGARMFGLNAKLDYIGSSKVWGGLQPLAISMG
jgi:hypothetical protein